MLRTPSFAYGRLPVIDGIDQGKVKRKLMATKPDGKRFPVWESSFIRRYKIEVGAVSRVGVSIAPKKRIPVELCFQALGLNEVSARLQIGPSLGDQSGRTEG